MEPFPRSAKSFALQPDSCYISPYRQEDIPKITLTEGYAAPRHAPKKNMRTTSTKTEECLFALCGLYAEVAVLDPERGDCRVLSPASSRTLFQDTQDFAYLGVLAKGDISPEDRSAFLHFFQPEELVVVALTRSARTLRFSLGKERRPMLVTVAPLSGKSVLCALRDTDAPPPVQELRPYAVFLRQFLQILDKVFDNILELNPETHCTRMLRSTGYDAGKSRMHDWMDILKLCRTKYVHEEDRAVLQKTLSLESLQRFAASSRGYDSIEVRLLRNGIYRWTELSLFTLCVEGNTRVLIAVRDIDQKKLLQNIVDRYVYKNCDYFIYLNADRNSYIMFSGSDCGTPLPPTVCDDYATELVRYARKFVVPEDVEMTIREMQLSRVVEQLEKYGEHAFSVGIMDPVRGYTRKRLQYIYYDRSHRMILLTRTDITAIYEEQKRLELAQREAERDSLTGLYNHATTLRLIEKRLAALPEEPAAVLFVDLDNFKLVNDRLGHQRGDKLLSSLAAHFRAVLRPADILGRIGGDEFIVLLPGLADAGQIESCAERLRDVLSAFLDNTLCSCGLACSIGIARYPKDGTDCAELIRKADAALYVAKRAGKNGVIFADQT